MACFGFGSSGANRGACTVGFFGKHVSNTVLAHVHRSGPDLKFIVSGRTTPTPLVAETPAYDVVDVDIGAAEPIDRLLRVAHDEERPWAKRHLPPVRRIRLPRRRRDIGGLRQPEDDLGLHRVGVLELVHQQVPVLLLERPSHADVLAQHPRGEIEQVAVVQRIQATTLVRGRTPRACEEANRQTVDVLPPRGEIRLNDLRMETPMQGDNGRADLLPLGLNRLTTTSS